MTCSLSIYHSFSSARIVTLCYPSLSSTRISKKNIQRIPSIKTLASQFLSCNSYPPQSIPHNQVLPSAPLYTDSFHTHYVPWPTCTKNLVASRTSAKAVMHPPVRGCWWTHSSRACPPSNDRSLNFLIRPLISPDFDNREWSGS